jgi:hypothetical protein
VNVREMRCGDVDWIHLAKINSSVVDSCEHGNKLLSTLKTPASLLLASQEPGQRSANLMTEDVCWGWIIARLIRRR